MDHRRRRFIDSIRSKGIAYATMLYMMFVDAAIVHRKRSKREVPGWVMMVGSRRERSRAYSMFSFPSKRVKAIENLKFKFAHTFE